MTNKLNPRGVSLATSLAAANAHINAVQKYRREAETVHIVGAGGALTAAYEQLRNAAEYAEEHMLLQRAIARFFRRTFLLRDAKLVEKSGEELAVELTLAGYLQNDAIPEKTITQINELAVLYHDAYRSLEKRRGITPRDLDRWTVRCLAVEVESLLNDDSLKQVYVQFAYEHFINTLDFAELLDGEPTDKETALYVAIHRALLKSDLPVIRHGLLRRYQQTPAKLDEFVHTNKEIDKLFESSTTEKLYRAVDRQGASLRILRHMIEQDDKLDEMLAKPDRFLASFEAQVKENYETIDSRINKGIIRSVIFLIITKALVGVLIEIPYDYLVHGKIATVPLVVNLLFPPLYMILLRMTLLRPEAANTKHLSNNIEHILYGDPNKKQLKRRASSFGSGYNFVYGLIFVAVFGSVATWLWLGLGFDILHLLIFFVFLSTASFLGFRLSRQIREIEAVDSQQNGVTLIRDFLYMPFVVVGRYMSDKYSKINIVAVVLDMLIELPLKTILRLVRQWSAFISSKKDQL